MDGTIAGHVALHAIAVGHTDWEAATGTRASELAAISRLFVGVEHRGAGLGGGLLEKASAEALARGLHPVLEVVEARASAMQLYERLGWRRVLTKPWSALPELSHHFYMGPRSIEARY